MELHTPERVVSVQGSMFVYQASLSTTHSIKTVRYKHRVYTEDILSTITHT
jgi:hypothetical protein